MDSGVKKVLITGSSRGIGFAIKKRLQEVDQYQLICPSRKELDLNDLSCISQSESSYQADIIVNNAGINILSATESIDDSDLDQMIQVNLRAPLQLIRNSIPRMKKNRWGRIVNISSIWGVSSKEQRCMYSMTKYGLNGLTKSLSKELGEFGVLVNSVCPGYVMTEMTDKNIADSDKEMIQRQIPLRRFADPVEIAEFVYFLISPKNTYITGQNILIDGGFV